METKSIEVPHEISEKIVPSLRSVGEALDDMDIGKEANEEVEGAIVDIRIILSASLLADDTNELTNFDSIASNLEEFSSESLDSMRRVVAACHIVAEADNPLELSEKEIGARCCSSVRIMFMDFVNNYAWTGEEDEGQEKMRGDAKALSDLFELLVHHTNGEYSDSINIRIEMLRKIEAGESLKSALDSGIDT